MRRNLYSLPRRGAIARWWVRTAALLRHRRDRRRLLKLLDRLETLLWAVRHCKREDFDTAEISMEIGLVTAELSTRGWWRAVDPYLALPRLRLDGEELPHPEDSAAAEAAALAAVGLDGHPPAAPVLPFIPVESRPPAVAAPRSRR